LFATETESVKGGSVVVGATEANTRETLDKKGVDRVVYGRSVAAAPTISRVADGPIDAFRREQEVPNDLERP
jgi:hypothetical protein